MPDPGVERFLDLLDGADRTAQRGDPEVVDEVDDHGEHGDRHPSQVGSPALSADWDSGNVEGGDGHVVFPGAGYGTISQPNIMAWSS